MAGAVAALGKIVSKSDGLVKGALKYGDDIAEGVAKYGDDVASALAKNSDEAADALSGISKYDDKVDDIVEQCTDGVHCFVAGTLVLTANGYKNIEDVEVGDKVIATDPETGETAIKEVKRIFENKTYELLHLTVNGETIVSTPGHKYYAPEKGWISAIELRAGDLLQLVNGEYVVVEAVQHEILEEPVTIYNFEVEDFHTYYVGEQSVLVHNRNCLSDDAIVVRGGLNQADQFTNGSGVTTGIDGRLDGVSVNSMNGVGLDKLTSNIPNGKVGVTTVGEIRKLGGDVVPSPTKNNPYHATLSGITAEQAEDLFQPVIPNPSRLKS